jgi:hypothetical protein
MKLSTITAKLTQMKSRTTRILAVAALATAALTAAAPAAHAQHLAVGVHVGGPYYLPGARPIVPVGPRFAGPVYGPAYGPGFYGPRFHEDWRAREFYYHHDDFRGRRGYVRPY